MTSIRISLFGGMRKRNSRGLNDPTNASLAKDVKLWHGTISPWRYPSLRTCTNKEKICKLHRHNCCFITSKNPCASFADDDDCCRIFSTGVMEWPAYASIPNCSDCGDVPSIEWIRLGLPKPVNKLSIVNSDAIDPAQTNTMIDSGYQLKREPRNYIYTYVNEYGEESNSSEPSTTIDTDVDSSVTLGFSIPPLESGYKVDKIRIYRGLPTTDLNIIDQTDQDTPSTSGYFLVDEIDFRTGNFTYNDNNPASDLMEMYIDNCSSPPPENLENIKMTSSGSLIGSTGKLLWFTEPYRYNAWSCSMNFDYCIESIGVVGDTIYLATTGKPYVISDRVSENDCLCCRPVSEILEPAPISCKNSFVETPTGVIWATNTGLVRLSNGSFDYLTLGYYGEDQFGEWLPHKLNAVYYKGQYIATNGHKSFIFDLREGIYNDKFVGNESSFSELSLTPDSMYVTNQDEFFLSFKGDIFLWDDSDTYLPYTWRSRLNVEGKATNLGYGKVVFENWLGDRPVPHPVTLKLYANDRLVAQRIVKDSNVFTLPRGYKSMYFEIEVEGIETIMEIHLASTMRELTLLNNT